VIAVLPQEIGTGLSGFVSFFHGPIQLELWCTVNTVTKLEGDIIADAQNATRSFLGHVELPLETFSSVNAHA
jgi:hypothetical protein